MGFRTALTAGLFRFTNDGRRIFAPFSLFRLRRIYYLVPDSEVRALERRYVSVFLIVVPGIIPIGMRVLSQRSWLLFLFLLVVIPLEARFWLPRGLLRIELNAGDFPLVDRRARALAHAHAVGQPTLWALLFAAILMTAGNVVILLTDGDWWAWLGLLLFGSCIVEMTWQIYLIRHASVSGPHPDATA